MYCLHRPSFTHWKKKIDSQSNASTTPVLCARGCGFYGSAATCNLCSKCYNDYLKELIDATTDSVNKLEPHLAALSLSQWKYDVFLNFRGGDVRDKFLSHLREALVRAKLETFFDEDLRRGEEISPALLKAIEESRVAVTIFSKDYASSHWCLEELVKIIECYECKGQIVIPVFYDVSSSDVLEQSGIYAEAFAKHERDRENARNVPKWKAAMTKAANLSGRSARNTRPESELVKEIVNDILISLGRTTDGVDGTVETGSGLQKSWSFKLSNTRTVEVQGTGDVPIGKLPIENLASLSEPLNTSDVEITTRQNNILMKTSATMPYICDDCKEKGLSNADSSHKHFPRKKKGNKHASELDPLSNGEQGNVNADSSYWPSLGTSGSSGLGNQNPAYVLGTIGSSGLGNLNANTSYMPAYVLGSLGSSGLGYINANPSYRPAYALGSLGSSGLGYINANPSYRPAYVLGSLGSSGLGYINANPSYRPAYVLGSLGSSGQCINAGSASSFICSTFQSCQCVQCRMSFLP